MSHIVFMITMCVLLLHVQVTQSVITTTGYTVCFIIMTFNQVLLVLLTIFVEIFISIKKRLGLG